MLDVEEPITKAKSSLFTGMTEDPDDESDSEEDDSTLKLLYEDEVETFLMQVQDVDEQEALMMLAAFEKEQKDKGEKKRTWKANKERKLAVKKDSRTFSKKSRPRLSLADLKSLGAPIVVRRVIGGTSVPTPTSHVSPSRAAATATRRQQSPSLFGGRRRDRG